MSGKRLLKFYAALVVLATLTGCLRPPVASETNNETFAQLNAVLPTASRQDSEQTRREVGVFRTLFLALCPDTVCGAPP